MERFGDRKSKLILGVVMLLLTAFLLAACGNNSANKTAAAASTQKTVTNKDLATQKTTKKVAGLQDQAAGSNAKTVSAKTAAKTTEKVAAAKTKKVVKQSNDGKLYCTLYITCASILNHMSDLDPAKKDLVPAKGVIYKTKKVEFEKGDTVFDVLAKETRANKIQMEFSKTPIYKSNYIEGLNNIYEFDCGPLSGWMYSVNGKFPNYGCSGYKLKNGDAIKWIYSCELGKDIGAPEWKEVAAPSD